MSGFCDKPLCPKAQIVFDILQLYYRIIIYLYPTDIISWFMDYQSKNVTFLSETKYTWIVHFTWPTIYLFTLYDRFEFKILITIYIIERYLISKIPSTVIWYQFQQDITYRDLFIFHYFRYLNLFQDFMKCYVNVLFYSTCLIIMTILIICSFLL